MKSCLAFQTLGKHPLSHRHALPLSAVSNSGISCTKWQTVRSDGWADSRLHGLVFVPRKGLPAARSTVIARLAGAFVGHHGCATDDCGLVETGSWGPFQLDPDHRGWLALGSTSFSFGFESGFGRVASLSLFKYRWSQASSWCSMLMSFLDLT